MEQKIVLHLTKNADLVCGWRAFFSSAFRGIYIILQQVFSPLVDRSKDPDKWSIAVSISRGWDATALGCKSRLSYGFRHARSAGVGTWYRSYCFEILRLTSWVISVGLGGCGVSCLVWVPRTPMPWPTRCIARPFWLHGPALKCATGWNLTR